MRTSKDRQRIACLVEELGSLVPNAREGLPLDVFYLVSRLTPLVNVDLLIQNEQQETLLVWRHDEFYHGWHIPGGIIRFKEVAANRIRAVAASELGATVEATPEPIAIHEKLNHERELRSHFISLLYRCKLTSMPDEQLRCRDGKSPVHGQWAWHLDCPADLIAAHAIYRPFLAGTKESDPDHDAD